jgi:hypothetical protein
MSLQKRILWTKIWQNSKMVFTHNSAFWGLRKIHRQRWRRRLPVWLHFIPRLSERNANWQQTVSSLILRRFTISRCNAVNQSWRHVGIDRTTWFLVFSIDLMSFFNRRILIQNCLQKSVIPWDWHKKRFSLALGELDLSEADHQREYQALRKQLRAGCWQKCLNDCGNLILLKQRDKG